MSNLTSREREIMLLVARGLTNRQVSTKLSISPKLEPLYVSRTRMNIDPLGS
jgi:DNA-binding NarL/FixJ family response regulator